MRIYLADLAHDYQPTRQFAPLGIGYLAAYLKKILGEAVDVRLFKSCDRLLEAIDEVRPDLVGMTNYTWSAELTAFAGRYIKSIDPDLPIVMGGPNIRTDNEGLTAFLTRHEYVDAYVLFAGEVALTQIVEELLKRPSVERTADTVRAIEVDGVSRLRAGQLQGNSNYHKAKELDFIPSPYQTGLLDEFLDAGYIPIIETNRGCPYTCTFCVWGISALNKLSSFSMERVAGDIAYVTGRNRSFPQLVFADANFGILPRDVQIAQMVRDAYERTKTFTAVEIYWSKSAQPHMVDIGRILGTLTHTYIAFQSLDDSVLTAIRRKNISTDRLLGIINQLRGYTHGTRTDILVGLPDETFDSHLASLDKALSYGINHILGGEIRLLPGSEMDTPASRKKFGIQTKWRLYEGGAGIYRGKLVYELEESIRATNVMAEEDMIRLRGIRALFFNGVTLGSLRPLIHVLVAKGVRVTELFRRILDPQGLEPALAAAFGWLYAQARREWYDTPDDLRRDMAKPGSAEALFGTEAFVKLNYGFTAKLLLDGPALEAYWRRLTNVAAVLLPDIPRAAVAGIVGLSRSRDYLARTLSGDVATDVEITMDSGTVGILRETGYLPADWDVERADRTRLAIDATVGERIGRALKEQALSVFHLSQVMQMFLGRCHLELEGLAVSEVLAPAAPEHAAA